MAKQKEGTAVTSGRFIAQIPMIHNGRRIKEGEEVVLSLSDVSGNQLLKYFDPANDDAHQIYDDWMGKSGLDKSPVKKVVAKKSADTTNEDTSDLNSNDESSHA